MIPLTNHDFQWGRSEVVIIYPDIYIYRDTRICTIFKQNQVKLSNLFDPGANR